MRCMSSQKVSCSAREKEIRLAIVQMINIEML